MATPSGIATLPLSSQYRTGESDPVEGLYRPCLSNAVEYKRAVGYFRSSVFLVIGGTTVEFARRGGKMRLVCSPSIENADAVSISEGYASRENAIEMNLIRELDLLLAQDKTAYRTRILATLVATGALEIRIAYRPNAKGLYHEKIGIFKDELGQAVSFLGSANETWNGWHFLGNHEALEVFCSWKGSSENERVQRHDQYFERLWNGLVNGVETVEFPDAAHRKLVFASLGSADDVDLTQLEEAPQKKGRSLLPHQITALEAWAKAGKKGVLEHATGSGKTFTAITAIKNHIAEGKPALVLVPSRLLLEQWALEVKEELPHAALMLAGAGHVRWKQAGRLRAMTDPNPVAGPRVLLSTMQTAASEEFRRNLRGGDHLMVVADEVHQSGSSHHSKLFTISSGVRLGLSATPTRFGDAEGTARIFSYFGDVVPPPFTLKDAIKTGRLVDYKYFPHPVRLTADEAEEWKRLTLQIVREMGRKSDKGPPPLSDRVKMLLIRRSRIAKKAVSKIGLAAEVISKNYEKDHRWLVYCEDSSHLQEVMEALRARGLSPIEYHTGMDGDKEATLDWFKTFGGVLVSIKCLDEGVDIPAVDHALILASSQNPRQFIQRRGRVLRKSPGKQIAVIHDAIVVPVSLDDEPEQTALLRSEYRRAVEFADSAINRGAAAELRAIAVELGFDPDEIREEGFEEDEE
jgi:superfamily II DNA or RNA helicase